MSLISCSNADSTDEINKLLGEWNLISYEGGKSGASCEYEEGDIVWTFSNSNLTIKNDPFLFSVCSPVMSNNPLKYSTINNDQGLFLVIDNIERGAITFIEDGFSLNPNKRSDGDLADSPIWTFK